MRVLLSCQSLTKSYHERPLFEDVTLGIHEGQRIGLIGPNGAGKSTFLKILSGREQPDRGTLSYTKHETLVYVPQVSSFPSQQTVEEVVLASLEDSGWEQHERLVETSIALSKAGFESHDQQVSTLSGGWKKRLSLACAIARKPSVLLLDEPTNHLDLAGIAWLEGWLQSAPFAWLVVTHDRYFLESIATTLLELNRVYEGGLFQVDGNYSTFLEKKAEYLSNQEQQQLSLANKMRREIEWLRRGPKARTTKAKARIQGADRLAGELESVKERNAHLQQKAGIDFTSTGRQTKELLVAKKLHKAMGGRELFGGLDLKLAPGTRLGMLGTNGSGKTTLMRLLMDDLEPDSGTIQRADQLKVVYFAQERPPLDQDMTLRQALASQEDTVIFRGRPLHVHSWARRFLFRDEQLPLKLRLLSGGEQARVHIARLMLRPADILLLDEPTNDLDIDTLEVLEENLLSFPGALILVTHDRYLLDRVADRVLGLTEGAPAEFFGDFAQWERHQDQRSKEQRQQGKATEKYAERPKKTKSLSYLEKKELEGMEEAILEAETQLEELQASLQDPAIASDAAKLQDRFRAVSEAEGEVERLYNRWSELEQKKAGE